jgi:ATP adenylyltransferase
MPAMRKEYESTERNLNLWAPWRMEYIDGLADGGDEGGCFLCRYRERSDRDDENLVLWRGQRCLALLNRYPYTGGHSMVAPFEHVSSLGDLSPETMREIMEMIRDLQAALAKTINAEGFNVGMNIGRCAGAGLPGHLHMHIVPRWMGDTNFMAVLGGARVIPQHLKDLLDELRRTGRELDLPNLTP